MDSDAIVLLSASNASGIHLDPYYLWRGPTDISTSGANVVAGPALLVLIMIAR